MPTFYFEFRIVVSVLDTNTIEEIDINNKKAIIYVSYVTKWLN